MAILDNLARNKSLKQYTKRVTNGNDLYQDLFHHCILKLYDLGEQRVVELNNEGNISGYLAFVMHREWYDKAGSFNKLHRRGDVEYRDVAVFHDTTEAHTSSKQDIDTCLEYFDSVTPERIQVAVAMKRMYEEDKEKKHFHYRTALLELYIELGGIRKVSRATGIHRHTIAKDLKNIIPQINNREGTDSK